ncbi:hypothetical protein O6H91_11G068300 [Diphasiastrum complanatum]|uniref:Uncharacterized protein n=1 Tax=Diphasiastrum complanatum TaxID=34168 RepID=A0ACC2CAC3_DIPCM|nr:hypothetical protein O6H91_11G068300 [Diphasiastrum complanatum]
MSCNGCRVLRKGCSDSCILRQCLKPIEGGDAQGYATAFVAKFFGRAAMMGFINAVPENQRAELFQSLLYEACGRTVNPVHGSLGLLCSDNWHACQAAVQTVLSGGCLCPPSAEAIAQAATNSSLSFPPMPSLWPPHSTDGFSNDLYGSSSWQTHAKARGLGGGFHGQQGAAKATASQSPSDSIFHPLPLKRKRHWDLQSNLNEKLLDCQSLSAGSTDQQEKKIKEGSDVMRSHKQQQQQQLMDPLKNSKNFVCKQEQEIKQQQFSEEDVNNRCLELTLSTTPCFSLHPAKFASAARRPSNPSCISLESEGSVTSLDSTQLSKTRRIDPNKKILDLLH